MAVDAFRQELRTLLQQRGMSIPALARASCYARQYVWEIAAGKKQPNQQVAAAFDRALGSDRTLLAIVERDRPGGAARGDGPAIVDHTSTTREGVEPVRRRDLLAGAAAVAATGLWPPAPAIGGRPPTAGLEALLLSSHAPTTTTSLPEINAALTAARSAFGRCAYGQLTAALPEIISAAHHAHTEATGQHRDQAHALLADAYRLGSELCVKLDDNPIAWVLADRAMSAARDSGNPETIAAATRAVAIAMRRAGHHRGAADLITSCAQDLDPTTATYPKLLCTAAYNCAQQGNRGAAETLIGEAETAAAQVADRALVANVTLYRVGVGVALGDSGMALRHAQRLDLFALSTVERYARACVDTARAWHLHGDVERAHLALAAAESRAPQEVRRPSVRALVSTMLYAPGLAPRGLRELAARVGVQ